MQLMVEGDKWELYIPSELAYGIRGRPPTIPPDSALVFVIEMIKIKGDKVPSTVVVASSAADNTGLQVLEATKDGGGGGGPRSRGTLMMVGASLTISLALFYFKFMKRSSLNPYTR